jgi:hypothetical protein
LLEEDISMKRTEYRCPYCDQTSSRKWNIQIHIQRRHDNKIVQAQLGSDPLHYPSSIYAHQKLQDANNSSQNFYYNSLSFQAPLQGNDSTSKMTDHIRDMHETMYQIAEIKKISNQFQTSFGSTDIISTLSMQQSGNSNTRLEWLKDYASLGMLDNMLRNNKNIGFRGHICNNCLHCWVDPVYSNSEDLKSLIKSTKPSPHMCDPKKVADIQMYLQDMPSKKNISENTLIDLLVILVIIYWCYYPQNRIYLRTEELTFSAHSSGELNVVHKQKAYPFQVHDDRTIEEEQGEQNASPPFNIQLEKINCNSVDIDLNSLEKSHWAYRAINEVLSHEESTIVLNDNDLREFVKSAKGSYGIYRGYMGGSIRHFLMFLSFTHPKPE